MKTENHFIVLVNMHVLLAWLTHLQDLSRILGNYTLNAMLFNLLVMVIFLQVISTCVVPEMP